MNYNRVILSGHLTRDPEIRYVGDGNAVAKFSIAINRKLRGGKEAVDYVDIVTWGKLAEACNAYLRKGSGALVEGQLRNRDYEKDGEKRRVTEVVARDVIFGNRPNGAPEPANAEESDDEFDGAQF